MNPTLKAVVEAMDAAYECRRCGRLTAPVNHCDCDRPDWTKASTENAARAGLEALSGETLARTLALLDLKQTASRAGPGGGEDAGHSAWTLGRPAEIARWLDSSWRSYEGQAAALLDAILKETP